MDNPAKKILRSLRKELFAYHLDNLIRQSTAPNQYKPARRMSTWKQNRLYKAWASHWSMKTYGY